MAHTAFSRACKTYSVKMHTYTHTHILHMDIAFWLSAFHSPSMFDQSFAAVSNQYLVNSQSEHSVQETTLLLLATAMFYSTYSVLQTAAIVVTFCGLKQFIFKRSSLFLINVWNTDMWFSGHQVNYDCVHIIFCVIWLPVSPLCIMGSHAFKPQSWLSL